MVSALALATAGCVGPAPRSFLGEGGGGDGGAGGGAGQGGGGTGGGCAHVSGSLCFGVDRYLGGGAKPRVAQVAPGTSLDVLTEPGGTSGDAPELRLFSGIPGGTLSPVVTKLADLPDAAPVAAGDLDGDGLDDVVLGFEPGVGSDNLTVFYSTNTTPTPLLPNTADHVLSVGEGTTPKTRALVVHDVDYDGNDDIVAGICVDDCTVTARVRVFHQDVADMFTIEELPLNAPSVDQMRVFDPGSEQGVRLVLLDAALGELHIMLLNPMLADEAIVGLSGASVTGMDAGDLDGDGRLDVVLGTTGGDVLFVRGQVNDVNEYVIQAFPGVGALPGDVKLSDLDGDGDVDVVVGTSDGLRWLERDGTDYAVHPIADASAGYRFLDTADLDGNGTVDIVSYSVPDLATTLLLNLP